MTRFEFMGGDDLRASLEADYREMNLAVDNGTWKAAQVLAGSIIEAILVDYLILTEYTKKDPLRMEFSELILACKAEGILSARTEEACNLIRTYRNLIHPGRMARLRETVDKNSAAIAQALVEKVIDEVVAAKSETYGYTAEQIVQKVEIHPSVVAILPDLLGETKAMELRRLLLDVIPFRYFELDLKHQDASTLPSELTGAEKSMSSLAKSFRISLEKAPDKLKRDVANRFVAILKRDTEHRIHCYEEAFFRASDMEYLSAPDRRIVKKHLLARLADESTLPLLRVVRGMEWYLTEPDLRPYVVGVVRAIVRPSLPQNVRSEAIDMLEVGYGNLDYELRDLLRKRLKSFADVFKLNNDSSNERALRDVIETLEAIDAATQIA